MSEKYEGLSFPQKDVEQEGIDVEKDPFAYNKDFDPSNPAHFEAWLKMRPSHMTEGEWQFAVGELKMLLESTEVKSEHDKSMVILGWKSKYKLLPEQK